MSTFLDDNHNLLKLVAAFTAEDGPACARISNQLTVSEISKILVSLQAIEEGLKLLLARRGYGFDRDLVEQTLQRLVEERLGGGEKPS